MREKTIRNRPKDTSRLPIVRLSIFDLDPPQEGQGLRLAVYQGQGQVGDREAIEYNFEHLKTWAASAAGYKAQLLALPELFLCGYNVNPSDVPHVVLTQDEVLEMVAPIAQQNQIAIVCPYAEVATVEVKTHRFDAIVLVDKNGTMLRNYRKTHLWGKDEKTNWWFPYVDNPQEAYLVDKVNGINVGLLNCYEAEFPELSRILALKGAQVIVIPTAADVGTLEADGTWSDWAYPDVSQTAIPGNAYQNKIFVAYANHALYEYRSDGTTLTGIYLGNSVIADPYGQLLVVADNVETLLIADCVPSRYEPTHPDGQSDYIKDRRPPLYGQLTSMTAILPDGGTYTYPEDPNKGRHPMD